MLASWSLTVSQMAYVSLTLEIGHESLGSRVECVDDHLAVCWASDLNPAY